MDGKEIKQALLDGVSVIYAGIEYKCVTAIIVRRTQSGGTYLQAELLDKNKNSVTIAPIERVERRDI